VGVGLIDADIFALGNEKFLRLNLPLATTIKTATTTKPRINESALLN
jgi:hypothetical protein